MRGDAGAGKSGDVDVAVLIEAALDPPSVRLPGEFVTVNRQTLVVVLLTFASFALGKSTNGRVFVGSLVACRPAREVLSSRPGKALFGSALAV
jgi:hypothetical protein